MIDRGLSLLLILHLIHGLVAGCATEFGTPPSISEPDRVEAHPFVLPSLDGHTLALEDLRGQWVIVNFWATWCMPCREEMPYLQALHGEDAELTVVGINMRESAKEVGQFVDELDLTFPILLDPDDETLLAYNVMGLPRTAVIGPDGSLVRSVNGPIQAADFGVWLVEEKRGTIR